MLWILLTMLGILVVAGLVVVYVAFPHRGEDVPSAPWIGDAMRRGADRVPTLEDPEDCPGLDDQPVEQSHTR